MGISIKVLDCDGLCGSCYENKIRQKSKKRGYDIEAICRTLDSELAKIQEKELPGRAIPCLHGGEPLLIQLDDMERLLKIIFAKFGRTSIQTNGLSMTDAHIDLFVKYKTGVGFSLDGDTVELNRGRWNAAEVPREVVVEGTETVLRNMRKCLAVGVSISLIVVLRKWNASSEALPELRRFLFRMRDEFKVVSVRTNEGIVYGDSREEELTEEELGNALVELAEACFADPSLQWNPYREVVNAFMGKNSFSCWFTECDVWKTTAEIPIDRNGVIGNCLKGGAAVDGIQIPAAQFKGRERYEALKNVPKEYGGCAGCRYWVVCKGGCPGEGIGNDWRNRTRFCKGYYRLFEHVERKLKGLMPDVKLATETPEKTEKEFCGHGDSHTDEHGDRAHGDHTDGGNHEPR